MNHSWKESVKAWLKTGVETKPFHALAVSVGAFTLPVLAYFGHDLVRSELSPCESIFEQTAVSLSTKITFLKTEGEIQIGKQKLADLGERAQMTALNLKTCCTVLNEGKLDPEQFLQCKEKGRSYDTRIEELVALVRASVANKVTEKAAASNKSAPAIRLATAGITGSIKSVAVPKNLSKLIEKKVEAARETSKQFNLQIVQVRKEQAFNKLEVTAPKNVEIAGQESEPNNDVLNTNVIELGKWVTAAVNAPKDLDYYVFTTPKLHRDWMRIEIQNRSTTLEPKVQLYNDKKAAAGGAKNTTAGGDLTYSFVAGPNAKYYLRVSNHYGESRGVYLLRVSPSKAYDAHEPNQDILKAKKVSAGSEVKAAIMDKYDVDYYVFENSGKKGKVTVKLQNRSTSLHPKLNIYGGNKVHMGERHSGTRGADLEHSFEAQPNSKYFVAVSDHYREGAGDYTLTIVTP